MKKKIAVLLSNKGTGSNLEAIIRSIKTGRVKNAEIVVVVSNESDAYGLVRARKYKFPTVIFDLSHYLREGKTRFQYDHDLGKMLKDEYHVDLVVLAGWMLIVSKYFLRYFSNKVINLHPGLLPDGKKKWITLVGGEKVLAIRGLHTNHAVKYALDHNFPVTGSTVHFITEKVDEGPVILRGEVPILPRDTVDSLYARMKKREHLILPEAISLFCEGKLMVRRGKVIISKGTHFL
ncbi:phosphoribosylglycinamide formyltransferase [Candidatus Gottesmanbacteria bacterium]|nr:phosphoribosylglycinamide formyltransferase [Candidatus Gottesmanbacteria bacterium]